MKKYWIWATIGVALLMLIIIPAIALAQTGVGASAFAAFERLWVVQGSGKTALYVQQDSTTASALLIQDGDQNTLLDISGAGDLTLGVAAGNNNAAGRAQFIGLPRIKIKSLGTGTNGSTGGKTASLMDDSPAGEFSASDADVTCTTDTTYYKAGTASLKLAVLAVADNGDGCHDPVTGVDWTDDESVGMWLYCDTVLAAGDLILDFTDDGGHQTVNFPAYSPADAWQWVELNIGAIANGDKNSISDISLELSTAGATRAANGAFNCYFDAMYKWDSTEEEALGVALVTDGVISIAAVATGAGSANTTSDLVEYTDYFVHYESGNDFVVWISDQSANSSFALVAY